MHLNIFKKHFISFTIKSDFPWFIDLPVTVCYETALPICLLRYQLGAENCHCYSVNGSDIKNVRILIFLTICVTFRKLLDKFV